MKRLALLLLIFVAVYSETLFEVKDASNNKVLDVSTDGLRVMNQGDTLMVIGSEGIKVYIEQDSTKALSRKFSVSTTSAKGTKAQSKVFEVATDEGATFYNPSDNSDEILNISKGNITANVNPTLNRDFIVNDQASAGKAGGGNLMKVSNEEMFETVNDSTMLWYKQKNAFRVGHVEIDSDADVGQASFASGGKHLASGDFSTVMGQECRARNFAAVAIGNITTADGYASVALGWRATAEGPYSFAAGRDSYAPGNSSVALGACYSQGDYSFAAGYGSGASGLGSTTIGWQSQNSGNYSIVLGSNNDAYGNNSTAIGSNVIGRSYNSLNTGRFNKVEGSMSEWIDTDPLFVIGNGSSVTLRSNAFEVKKDGTTYIPSLYTTSSDSTKKSVYVDSLGKLCVAAKGDVDYEKIERIIKENTNLKDQLAVIKRELDEIRKLISKE